MARAKTNRAAMRRDSQRFAEAVAKEPQPLHPELASYLKTFLRGQVSWSTKEAIQYLRANGYGNVVAYGWK